jgi:hypothetical protein
VIRAYVTLLGVTLLVGILSVLSVTWSERRTGAAEAERDAARAEAQAAQAGRRKAAAVAESLRAALTRQEAGYARASADAGVARARLVAMRDSLRRAGVPPAVVETLVVSVPFGDLERLEREADSCKATLITCRELVAAERRTAAATADERDAARRELRAQRTLSARPWTSLGLVVDPQTMKLGLYVERDILWRLRVGVDAHPAGIRARIGPRW